MKEKTSLAKNYIYNTIYTSLNVLFPLVTIPYLSRVLLPEGVGKVSYATNIVSWFTLFASLGIPRYGVREMAKARKKGNEETVFFELFSINAVASLVASVVYYLLIFLNGSFKAEQTLYMIVGIQVVLNMFNVDWFYQGMEDYLYITRRSILIKTISLVSIFLFVGCERDYLKYAIILVVATVGNYIFNVIHVFNYITCCPQKLSVKRHLGSVIVLFSTQIAVSLYALLDTTMIGIFCKEENVAYYSYPVTLVRTIVTIITAIGTVMLPRLTILVQEKKYIELKMLVETTLNILLFLSIPAFCGLLLVSRKLVLFFFGEAFEPAVNTIRILAFLIPIMSLGNLFGTQLLMAFNKEKQLLYSVVLGSIVNMSLNFILIRKYAQNGAAFASVVTELLVMLIQVILVNRNIRIKIDFFDLLKTIISVLFMCAVVLVINRVFQNGLAGFFLSIMLGAIVYISVAIFLKEKVCVLLWNMLRKK
jgi:O-antigen/teichoic acid export membrane protein